MSKPTMQGIVPWPCVRDENGELKKQNTKMMFAKINEELDEFKLEVNGWLYFLATEEASIETIKQWKTSIAEEAADTITAITTMLEVMGIDCDMRNQAQIMVNRKNESRGRL